MSRVERRYRHHVEDRENEIQQDRLRKGSCEPRCSSFRNQRQSVKQECRDEREDHIRQWPGHSNKRHVAARVCEALEGHRHRLCPAEQERSRREEQNGWKQDSSERINVLDRVERHTPKAEGCVIPQLPSCESMGCFMK